MLETAPEKSSRWSRLGQAPLPEKVKAWLADGSDRSVAKRTAGTVFLIRVLSAVVVFFTQVLLARWMGRFEYGVYVYVWTWLVFLGLLCTFGLANAAQRYIPTYRTGGEDGYVRGFITASRWLCFGNAALVAVVLAGGIILAGDRIPDHYFVPFMIACIALPVYTASAMQDFIARSFNWVQLALLPMFVILPMIVLASMGIMHLVGREPTAVRAVAAVAGGLVVTGVIQGLFLRRWINREVAPAPPQFDLRLWSATALGIFMVDGFNLLLTNIDILVLQLFVSPADIAIYFAATKTLALVNFIYFAVTTATAHRFSAYHSTGDTGRLNGFIKDAVRWTFWPSLVATLVMLAVGKPFLAMFGPGFSEGYPLMFVLSIGFLVRASLGPAERLLNMVGQQKLCAVAYGAAFFTSLVLCLILIPHFGPMGAAAATATAIVVESVLLFAIIKKKLGLHVFIIGGGRDR